MDDWTYLRFMDDYTSSLSSQQKIQYFVYSTQHMNEKRAV